MIYKANYRLLELVELSVNVISEVEVSQDVHDAFIFIKNEKNRARTGLVLKRRSATLQTFWY